LFEKVKIFWVDIFGLNFGIPPSSSSESEFESEDLSSSVLSSDSPESDSDFSESEPKSFKTIAK
jgi:hypothetical protein